MNAHTTTDRSPLLQTMPATRRGVLESIKRAGETRAEDIAQELSISVQAVRQHLVGLERDGVVAHRIRRDGPGRPKFFYHLTDLGDRLFPRNYADLTNELLQYVEDEDPQILERVFDRRASRRVAQARERIEGLPFPEQVRLLAEILDADGYLADYQEREDGTFLIQEHNCAVLAVARRHGLACSSELGFLQEALPQAEVRRVVHRLAGGHMCAYEIKPLLDRQQ